MPPGSGNPNITVLASWAAPSDVTEADVANLDAPLLTDMLEVASEVLYMLSGRQFSGVGSDTVRPCSRTLVRDYGRPVRAGGSPWGAGGLAGFSGGWTASGGNWVWGYCTCNQVEDPGGNLLPAVTLGRYPLVSITEVLIDGVAADPATYTIRDNRELVRLADPSSPGYPNSNPGWPCCQRMDLPPTQPGTWQVEFTFGSAPPRSGVRAAAELGYQLYLAAGGPNSAQVQCRLPGRVQSVARQGVNAILIDPLAMFKEGKTGLILCDYFLEAYNPAKLRRRATIWSPDIGRRVHRTGP